MRSPWVVQSVVAFTRLLLCVQGVFVAVIAWAGLLAWRHSSHQELFHCARKSGRGMVAVAGQFRQRVQPGSWRPTS